MEIPKKRIPWIKYFFHFVLPAFLLSAKVSAQGRSKKPKPETTVAPQTMMLGEVYFPETKDATIEQLDIQGRVVNEEGIPVPFATVIIKGTTTGTAADSTGLFRIRGVVFDKNKAMVLAASSVGYDPKEIVVARLSELTKDITIQLSKQTMQEVVVIGYGTIKGRVMMGGIGVSVKEKWIGDIETITTPEEKPAMIKVYPNPVSSGSTINIGCEKLEEGYYTLRLFNQSGQQLQNQQIWIDNEARIMNLQLPAVAAGHYILTLTNKESGKKFTEKIIVQ